MQETRRQRTRTQGRLAHKPASRSLLADIVESSDDAIFSRHLDGTVNTWNPAAERIFGYNADEIIGRSSVLLLPPDRPDEMMQLMERIGRGERIEHFETVRLHKNGRPVAVLVSVSPIRDARGRVLGASTIARDVTAQRRLEAEVLEIAERERQRIGRDLHDGLGQQLGGLELLCRTLARRLRGRRPTEARTAAMVVAQLHQAREQTRALARGLTPVMASSDGLMQALDELADTTRKLFRLRCTFRCDEPVLTNDHAMAVHLYRIAQEGVTNSVRHGKARRIEIALERRLGKVVLEVRDDGSGLPHGFEQSSGMGLRTMRYRSRMAGGSFKIKPAPSRGTVVTCVVAFPNSASEILKKNERKTQRPQS